MAETVGDLDREFKQRSGNPYIIDGGKLTLKDFICRSLDFVGANSEREIVPAEEKYKRHRLGDKVYFAKETVRLDSEEIERIKKCADKFSNLMAQAGAAIYSIMCDAIEPPKKEKKDVEKDK